MSEDGRLKWIISITTGGTKVMPPIFSENVIAVTMKFACVIQSTFAIIRLLFQTVSVIFNTLLPMWSKKPYTDVVKFPASTSEHITETLFQFTVVSKTAFT
jgi:hypothetical protein